ncbi:SDR family NAD(P)-dependent oxidoreductase [Treponema sp.]|uniref:SDR family NAD(P)-dependent oxidoreductase n=1 Tax=Treponema sp. TaxID=166 RepID=UPI0025E80F25|nr:SDR family oxidoreductase [Treponema sp.]MCR5218711.1 SDR family oxidoreductase [Treponema sp.]
MKVVITGTSSGIGKETALKFLSMGHEVIGLDIEDKSITLCPGYKYTHYVCDISKKESLPQIEGTEILINNAGVQTMSQKDIDVNLTGTMNVTSMYAFNPKIKSVLFNSSASALTGNEFPEYAASKAGVNGYMKYCAIKLANKYKATCNALCFGGVITELNNEVMQDKKLWDSIMNVTPLKRWATAKEAAEWIYFMTVTNTFCTGQAIEISGGERNCTDLFVWPE